MPIPQLADLAKADRQPALALTDTDNMFGALEFSDKLAGAGIQPIIGCELAIDFADLDPNARGALNAAPARIVLLAARETGYRNLMRLNSRAFMETPTHQAPHIKLGWLDGHSDGLIALTGGPDGPIALALGADQPQLAASRLDSLMALFGDRLYVELQRHGLERERRAETGLIDLAYAKSLPLVATNEPYFATARRLRGSRRAVVHRRRQADCGHRPRAAHGRPSFQDPRRDGRAVRRFAGGTGIDRRDRRPLRLSADDPQTHPAALYGGRRRVCGGR